MILAFNRDEFLNRPTAPASWEDDILAGRDLASGKKGGTWMAISQNGKFAMLTNVYTGVAQQVSSTGGGQGDTPWGIWVLSGPLAWGKRAILSKENRLA